MKRETIPFKRPAYLQKMNSSVRTHFERATSLPVFLSSSSTLNLEDRKTVVRQALLLIEQNYAHLPLKRAMHAIDPVQRLKLLLQTLEFGEETSMPPETEFHHEMTDIFMSLRDLHTNYLLPDPFRNMTAFLPFMVEDYFEGKERRYLVSHVSPGFSHPTFGPGVEVVYWNGMPIEKAVLNNAARYAGSNREARLARGVQTLTTRALIIAAAPSEEWVIVGYRTVDGELKEIRFDWMVNPPLPTATEVDSRQQDLAHMMTTGLDLEQDLIQQMRKALFAPQVIKAQKQVAVKLASGETLSDLDSTLPHIFQARTVTTPSGTFGYLRIFTFSHQDVPGFINEFMRLITLLPEEGLMLDVRSNGGGIIMNGEFLLQLLTPRPIEPEPVQFINTPLNLMICRNAPREVALDPWIESLKQALQSGASFSAGFPISETRACNQIGQRYFGPVVLIVDSLCYSTTDIFAAGFQDHNIGPVLGTDGTTGAGGANVWTHTIFSQLLTGADSPYKPLPKGTSLRVAVRRTLRVGRRAGTPVEDFGVIPDERHFLTRNDLLNKNQDLINRAGAILSTLPVRKLKTRSEKLATNQVGFTVEVQGITRIDVYVAERPIESIDIKLNQTAFTLSTAAETRRPLEIRAYDGSDLVGRYRAEI
ncbi:S41 family peptidase [Larkinella sp. GY13]|uniref:S41 family peptidase n=1 Tax=Larkinella sp. GY13 TaxID=3453720 RepID=UPI003EEB9D86